MTMLRKRKMRGIGCPKFMYKDGDATCTEYSCATGSMLWGNQSAPRHSEFQALWRGRWNSIP